MCQNSDQSGGRLPEGRSPSAQQAAQPQVTLAIARPNLDRTGQQESVFDAALAYGARHAHEISIRKQLSPRRKPAGDEKQAAP
jgi:hypothetical protein